MPLEVALVGHFVCMTEGEGRGGGEVGQGEGGGGEGGGGEGGGGVKGEEE